MTHSFLGQQILVPHLGGSPPVADFSADVTTGDAPLSVAFTDLSTNTRSSWLWDFGDTNTSTSQNPTHIYASPGVYTITLTATNGAGSDSETKANYITALWTPAFVTPDGGVTAHTKWYGLTGLYTDAAKASPATTDGAAIYTIDNQGSDNYDFVQATAGLRPTLKLNIINGKPVLRFSGDYIKGTFAGAAIAQPYTIFAIAQLDASVVNDNALHFLIDGDSATERAGIFQNSATTPDKWAVVAGTILTGNNASDSNWNIWHVLFNGASSQFWLGTVSQVSGNAGAQTTNAFILGATVNGSAGWVGDLAALLVYPGALSAADVAAIGAWASRYSGVAFEP